MSETNFRVALLCWNKALFLLLEFEPPSSSYVQKTFKCVLDLSAIQLPQRESFSQMVKVKNKLICHWAL